MNSNQLIHFLEAASGPVPRLNNEIARVVGYSTVENPDPNAARRMIWLTPEKEKASVIPNYTGSIDEAVRLVQILISPQAAAFTFRDGGASAQLEGEPAVNGATPALALCIAAIRAKMKLEA